MASVLGAIRALIKTHLETTSIEYALNGEYSSERDFPAAFFQIYDATHSTDVSSTLDRTFQLEIMIVGTVEQVDLALEEIIVLWLNQAKFLELQALGVNLMRNTQDTPPIVQGKMSDNKVEGYAVFELEVRYDYTT